ncbi:hypothetical protein A6A08_18875 [Nocardiopsis sp. TSRI0078]|uniref:hypothetical protein n=1 Tax=unclassified Nocardiopsis TaxID=2649073 RepID=UPI00095F1B36|nr:hypothetical protein [Nocardiopsis sp. TSRI0078]OKI22995.1 hypothetical protein A6A08_18875 [Nocardiopsis sp. TSRI0078]
MSAPPSAAASRTPHEHAHATTVPWMALAWSAAALGLGLGWLGGVVPAGESEQAAFGALFSSPGSTASAALSLVMGLVGVVCAVLMLRRGGGALVQAGAWALSGTALVVFVNGQLLSWLGYSMILPVVGWFLPGLVRTWVEATFTPSLLSTLFFTAGVVVWAVVALVHRRAVRAACRRCGRGPRWTPGVERDVRVRALRLGRVAVAVACVFALFYPSLRLPWVFGVPVGVGEEEFAAMAANEGTVMIGVGLGTAGLVGAVLMLGLVQRWGVRFPWWMAGVRGRRVPVGLAVVPATLVAVALVAMGRSVVVELLRARGASLLTAEVLHTVAFASMLVWGAALGVATAAYAVRRRAGCPVCGRGLPEVVPGRIRAMV